VAPAGAGLPHSKEEALRRIRAEMGLGSWEKENTIGRCERVENYQWLKKGREAVRKDRRKTGVNRGDFG